jgi:uncharacterized protein YkwD
MTRFPFIALFFIGLFFIAGCSKTADNPTPVITGPSPLATEMLQAVNALRTKGCNCGTQVMPPVPTLRWHTQLEAASKRHAINMEAMKSLTHTGSDGSTVQKRIDDSGYRWSFVSENIAVGYKTVMAVMDAWFKSEGHCKNMMSNSVIEMGASQSGDYWVQDFGKP